MLSQINFNYEFHLLNNNMKKWYKWVSLNINVFAFSKLSMKFYNPSKEINNRKQLLNHYNMDIKSDAYKINCM